MQEKEFFDRIRKLIAAGKLPSALEAMAPVYSDKTTRNALMALLARHNNSRQMLSDGVMPHQEYLQELSKFSKSALDLVDRLEDENAGSKHSLEEIYQLSLARLKVLQVLGEDREGLTIRQIHDRSGLESRRFLVAALQELIDADMVERFKTENGARNKLSTKGQKFAQKLR